MQLNFKKTIVEVIDEAVAKAPRTVESVVLTLTERNELYRTGGDRIRRARDVARPKYRGKFQLENGRWIEVFAAA